MVTKKAKDIDAYIAGFPVDVQLKLQQIRSTIKKNAPLAQEAIKYGMPTFVYKGNLVYFAAYKNHIGFYPAPTGNKEFADDLALYKTGKGSIQFPLDKRLPITLITRMVRFRVKQNLEKGKNK